MAHPARGHFSVWCSNESSTSHDTHFVMLIMLLSINLEFSVIYVFMSAPTMHQQRGVETTGFFRKIRSLDHVAIERSLVI
jgi:hypothetical protein